ncbi:MAG: hypothetical protein GY782_08670 [Gammaproteobacteria bacterium]|nr:hypothetical protein [Gammaproteobacteria bacterium]
MAKGNYINELWKDMKEGDKVRNSEGIEFQKGSNTLAYHIEHAAATVKQRDYLLCEDKTWKIVEEVVVKREKVWFNKYDGEKTIYDSKKECIDSALNDVIEVARPAILEYTEPHKEEEMEEVVEIEFRDGSYVTCNCGSYQIWNLHENRPTENIKLKLNRISGKEIISIKVKNDAEI